MLGYLTAHILNPGIGGILACIVFCVLNGQIFSFLFIYVKRLITVSFLVMVSPLICITYSLDKLGDGKAQALNAWLKEFSYNVLIQPFHCVIYLSFMQIVFKLVVGGSPLANISGYILSVFVIFFMKDAEKLLRQIFHFQASVSGIGEAGQTMMNATGQFAKMGAAVGTSAIAFKNSGGFRNMKKNLNIPANIQARKELKNEFASQNDGSTKGFAKYRVSEEGNNRFKEIRETNVKNKKEKKDAEKKEKIEKKAREIYDAKHGAGEYDNLKSQSEETRDGNLTENAKAAKLALDAANEKASSSGVINHAKKNISGAAKSTGKVYSNFREYVKNNGLEKFSSDMVIAGISAATGFTFAGAQGNLQGFFTGQQLASGIMKPILNNSARTIEHDTAVINEKYSQLTGQEDIPTEIKILNIQNDIDSGAIDQLIKDVKDATDKIRKEFGNDALANKMISEIKKAIVDPNQKDIDIQAIMDKYTSTITNATKKARVEALAGGFAEDTSRIEFANQIKKSKSAGYSVSYLAEKVDEINENIVENNSYSYTFEYDESTQNRIINELNNITADNYDAKRRIRGFIDELSKTVSKETAINIAFDLSDKYNSTTHSIDNSQMQDILDNRDIANSNDRRRVEKAMRKFQKNINFNNGGNP